MSVWVGELHSSEQNWSNIIIHNYNDDKLYRKLSVCITKDNRLMMFWDIIVLYCKTRVKHI
jgi:hypothetical protein